MEIPKKSKILGSEMSVYKNYQLENLKFYNVV